jgi:hypothetical protein
MGGAFTSLGADLAAATINPAGLAMYGRGEFGVSPSVVSNHDIAKSPAGLAYQGDSFHNKFTLNNLGVTFNTYQGSGTVTSRQFAVGYNRLAVCNTSLAVATPNDRHTIASLFFTQLNSCDGGNGIPSAELLSPARPFDDARIGSDLWGSILAYKTGLIDTRNGTDADNHYSVAQIHPDILKSHYSNMDSDGSAGEFYIAGAMNIRNRLYLGYTLSLISLRNEQYCRYEEAYDSNPLDMTWMQYNQHLRYSGAGAGLKLGAVIRPTDDLRIGVAFHTPQFMSVSRKYIAHLYTEFRNGDTGDMTTPALEYDYDYTTPPRLLLGASYAIGRQAVVSVDYEAVWYNGMRSSDRDYDFRRTQKALVKADFKMANNLRIGAEYKPLPMLAVRAGYARMGAAVRDKGAVFAYPAPLSGNVVSAGVGWRSRGGASLDLTYALGRTEYSNYDLYYYEYSPTDIVTAGDIASHRIRNLVTFTFGQRF